MGFQDNSQGTGFSRFVFPAVAHQVVQHPGKLIPVHPDRGSGQGGGKGQLEPVLFPVIPLPFYVILHIGTKIHGFPVEGDLVQVQLGKEKEGLVQLGHVFRGFQDLLEIALPFFRGICNAVLDSGGIALDLGQGRGQVMGDPGQHFLPAPFILLAFLPGPEQFPAALFKSP